MIRGLIVLVAVLAGGLAAWISLGAPSTQSANLAANALGGRVASTDVLVAADDLDRGTVMDENAMRWQPWPQDLASASFITRNQRPDAIATLAGLVLRNGLVAGEPILDARLAEGEEGALSVILSPGKRAVAVRISAENSAGGFVLPNDRVDVVVTTTQLDNAGNKAVSSRLILKNVKVLAVDQAVDSSSEAVVGKTATLELKPEEVEIVTAAETLGALSLALRPMSDNGDDPALPVPAKTPLRIFRGGKLEMVDVK